MVTCKFSGVSVRVLDRDVAGATGVEVGVAFRIKATRVWIGHMGRESIAGRG